jgi:hypothetical protein
MAGYSGTPLDKKLGLKPNFRVSLFELPADVESELKPALQLCRMDKANRAELDFSMLFVKSRSELTKLFPRIAAKLAPAGMLWVSWPKKASKVPTDLDENLIREIGLHFGLVDVKVCAVNEVWSGLKFVIRVKDRKS